MPSEPVAPAQEAAQAQSELHAVAQRRATLEEVFPDWQATTWTSKVPRIMAQHLKIESIGSMGSIILGYFEDPGTCNGDCRVVACGLETEVSGARRAS